MASGSKAIVAALMANAGIAVAKFVGFALTGASSMLAEAVHSVADSGNQALLLLGAKAAQKKATDQHPFGFGRERYFWSFIVALVIFLLGGMFAIYEGVHKLKDPHPIESPAIAIAILGLAILLEGWSFKTAIAESRALKGNNSWAAFIRHAKVPELPVVLLEDLGALMGLVIALGGVLTAMATGDGRFDAIGSIAIGILLTLIAVVLCMEMKSLLLGEAADPLKQTELAKALTQTKGVRSLIHMRTVHLGPDEILVGAKVEFDSGLSGKDLADAINAVETNMRTVTPTELMIYIEPDIKRA